jgi:DNA helicase IV
MPERAAVSGGNADIQDADIQDADINDADIRAERAHLDAARAALRRMHQEVVETDTPLSDSEDRDEIWHNTVYRQARAQRAQALIDLPDVPLFFGRLDYEPGTISDPEVEAGQPASDVDRIYVGRRHVRDTGGTPLVVDWRAPISAAFYRATVADPMGVRLRRRYGFSGAAELTAFEDEPLAGDAGTRSAPGTAGSSQVSGLVAAEIERPRSGPMRDIVATIQPEQDDLVRAPLHPTLCIQGAPGTGKTAVGLHRLAYLLYTEGVRLSRGGGVVVVGPNRTFLGYIRHVLPALGELDVTQTTIEDLIGGRRADRDEDPRTARMKADARMAAVLHRALWLHVTAPDDGLVYVRGSYRYRVSSTWIARTIEELRGVTRYRAGRAMLAQRLAHAVLLQMERRGAAPDDRDQDAVARSRPVRHLVDTVWPKVTGEQVLFRLLSDASFLAEAAGRDLTAPEQALLCWSRPARSWRSARWSPAEAVLLDELADLIERTPSLGHIVVDEAQDLSPMQCRALGRRCATGSLTVLGDIAQGTSAWASDDWRTTLTHLGKPDARLAVLEHGFRVPAQIIDYAARLLPHIAPHLGRPTSMRQSPGAVRITATTAPDLLAALAAACQRELKGEGSVGLVAADADIDAVHQRLLEAGLDAVLLGRTDHALESSRLVCVPATLAKGLEFDAVVVAEPARIVAAEPRGFHRLYVALTRAVSVLHIVHASALPDALCAR